MRLASPDGAAVVGGPFSLQVLDAPRNSFGVLLGFLENGSGGDVGFTQKQPIDGAMMAPIRVVPFETGPRGRSIPLLATPAVDASLCGEQIVYQAFVFHPRSPLGFRFSERLRVRVGESNLFLFPSVLESPDRTRALEVADMDGDGLFDLIHVTDFNGGHVGIQLGLASGGFGTQVDTSLAVTIPESVTVADFDGDGDLDLVAGSSSVDDTISVLAGDGTGGLGVATQYASGQGIDIITTGDTDNDGDLDVVATPHSDDNLWIHRGDGNGSFLPAIPLALGTSPKHTRVADLDEDGISDLVIALVDDDSVGVLMGNAFFSFDPLVSYGTGISPVGIVDADLDGDTVLDVATGDSGSDTVSVLRGNGNGTLSTPVAHAAGSMPGRLLLADVDDDGESSETAQAHSVR